MTSTRQLIFGLFALAFISRILFPAHWLEDWDSVQFALGLHHFSVVDHQPHPPGYPLYILLGKLAFLIFQDDTKALTFLSILLSSLSTIPLYLLTQKMFGKLAAIIATVFFILMPVGWITSEIPISNTAGLFFTIALGYLLYTTHPTTRYIAGIAFIFGLSQGVRATDMIVAISLLSLQALHIHNLKLAALLLIFFGLGIAAWLLPTMLITGPIKFIQASQASADYVLWHDLLQGKSFDIIDFGWTRTLNLLRLLDIGFTPIFMAVFAVSAVWLYKNRPINYPKLYLLAWLIPYALLLLLFYNQELPQYTLPLLPPLSIIAAAFFSFVLSSKYKLQVSAALVLLTSVVYSVCRFSISQVITQSATLPPTIGPVLYVKKTLLPADTILITTFTYRQFQYYAPLFPNYYGLKNSPNNINSKFVVIDYLPLKDQISALTKYKIRQHQQFSAPGLFFPRLHQTQIYILENPLFNMETLPPSP